MAVIFGRCLSARAFVLRTGPISVVPALRASIAIAALALAGCNRENPFGGDGPNETSGVTNEIRIWTDPSTGCHYLNWRKDIDTHAAAGSISIRYRADGTPDCPAAQGMETQRAETENTGSVAKP